MVDVNFLRMHYGKLHDDELQRLVQGEMVPEARAVLEGEMRARGVAPLASALDHAELVNKPNQEREKNPYLPPLATVADSMSETAILKVSGLLRIFQTMVVASTLIWLFLFASRFLPIPIAPDLSVFRDQAGAGALAPAVTQVVSYVAPLLWILSAIGLFFLRWWGRRLFVATYAVTCLADLLGGAQPLLVWEVLFATAILLLDGAVLAIAFLPPLSVYFRRGPA
jgi:hypothetical protein